MAAVLAADSWLELLGDASGLVLVEEEAATTGVGSRLATWSSLALSSKECSCSSLVDGTAMLPSAPVAASACSSAEAGPSASV